MRKVPIILLLLTLSCLPGMPALAIAGTVPPITPAEFTTSVDAHPIWAILAGDGLWGALLIGALGFIWRWLRPSILAYARQRDLENMFLVCETFVADSTAKYGEGYKAANADGKLTKDEAAELFYRTKQDFIIFMQAQGKDVVKLYGDRFIDAMIEFLVAQLKLPKAVTVPLPASFGSAPLPQSVMEGVRSA